MTLSLSGFQSGFIKALFEVDEDGGTALTRQPAFAVYRNTVMSACIDALQANFPSVVRLVGVDWFRAAASAYVRVQPPRDGRMLFYGESFADFLAEFGPAAEITYLADVARLDRFWIEAHTAPDATAVDSEWLARLPAQALGALRLLPHPSARWRCFADMPIYSIWERNRLDLGATDEIIWQGEGALLVRPIDQITWRRITPGGAAFLDACAQGRLLAQAAGAALQAQPDTDIAHLLAQLLSAGALIDSSSNAEGCT